MKRLISLILVCVLAVLSVRASAGVPATLNQKMATRSGPGTRYTEELGTIPKDTPIVVINSVTTKGTPWCLVEFTYNGKLYRCYTGLKRINTTGNLPKGSADYTKNKLTKPAKIYYGPGSNYAERKGSFSKGEDVRVFEVEGDWALVEYKHGKSWERGYISVDCLKKTVSKPTPAPTAVFDPNATPAPRTAGNILDRSRHLCTDYYGNTFDYGGNDDNFVILVGALPVMSYIDSVPCVRHAEMFSGPSTRYWRPRNPDGYAGILNTELRVYGQENGWIMIRCPSDANGGYRYGWVVPSAISPEDQARTPQIDFARLPAVTTKDCIATDDPDVSARSIDTFDGQTQVSALAFLNEERAWVYCEFRLQEGTRSYLARAFIPADSLTLL